MVHRNPLHAFADKLGRREEQRGKIREARAAFAKKYSE
jgi:hypothetical protein